MRYVINEQPLICDRRKSTKKKIFLSTSSLIRPSYPSSPTVGCFDQRLGAAHSKCWLNILFSHVKCKKEENEATHMLLYKLLHSVLDQIISR